MIHRSLFLALFTCLTFLADAQPGKKPAPKTTPTAPRPKVASGSGNTGGNGAVGSTNGFRILTVPVYGDYKLGMEKKEFDLVGSTSRTLSSGVKVYPLKAYSRFIGERLFTLSLKTETQELDSLPKDIFTYFIRKYDTPDTLATSERSLPAAKLPDSANQAPIQVINSFHTWKFRYYELNIVMTYQRKPNGKFYGETELNFTGNPSYFGLLRDLEMRKDY